MRNAFKLMRKTTIRKIGKGYEQQFRKEEIEKKERKEAIEMAQNSY